MLKIAALLNFVISLGHIVALFFLRDTFRYFGIENILNGLFSIHPFLPFIVTIVAAVAFFICGLYALSADGVIRRLPLLEFGIYLIGILFLAKGIMEFFESIFSQRHQIIVAVTAISIGLLYLVGGYKRLGISISQ